MKLDTFVLQIISNKNKLVTYFKNDNVTKKFDDVISHQSEIKKFQVFGFYHNFQLTK